MDLSDIRLFREAMRKLQRSSSWQWKNDAACCGITAAQCHALLEIGKNSEITLVDLASILELDTSTLSRTIDNMVQANLVERKTNPEDRRYLSITLTKKGVEIFNDINYTFDQFYTDIFADIPLEKQAQIIESINMLANALTKSNNKTYCRKEPAK